MPRKPSSTVELQAQIDALRRELNRRDRTAPGGKQVPFRLALIVDQQEDEDAEDPAAGDLDPAEFSVWNGKFLDIDVKPSGGNQTGEVSERLTTTTPLIAPADADYDAGTEIVACNQDSSGQWWIVGSLGTAGDNTNSSGHCGSVECVTPGNDLDPFTGCTCGPWVILVGLPGFDCGNDSWPSREWALIFNPVDSIAGEGIWEAVRYYGGGRGMFLRLTVSAGTATLHLIELENEGEMDEAELILSAWSGPFCCCCSNELEIVCVDVEDPATGMLPLPCDGLPRTVCMRPVAIESGEFLVHMTTGTGCTWCDSRPTGGWRFEFSGITGEIDPGYPGCCPDLNGKPIRLPYHTQPDCTSLFGSARTPACDDVDDFWHGILIAELSYYQPDGDIWLAIHLLNSIGVGVSDCQVALYKLPIGDWDCDGDNVMDLDVTGVECPCDDLPATITVSPVKILVDEDGNPVLDGDGDYITSDDEGVIGACEDGSCGVLPWYGPCGGVELIQTGEGTGEWDISPDSPGCEPNCFSCADDFTLPNSTVECCDCTWTADGYPEGTLLRFPCVASADYETYPCDPPPDGFPECP